jgi:glutathione synthase/RimK-type ligase-like ATP-grasp enzyme
MRRYILSKLAKTRALLQNPRLAQYVPSTKKLDRAVLEEFLHKHKMVYVKPDKGTFGKGVMRVEWQEGGLSPYLYQTGTRVFEFTGFDDLYRSIRERTKGRSYVVQRGIHLLKYRGNRFDIRVMVQLGKKGWRTTGMIGRVAQAGKIVTNYHNGGKPRAVELLLDVHLAAGKKKELVERLERLGVRAARQMHKAYPGVREIGVDVALDEQFHPWILEVNTRPDPYIFRNLKDKRIYARVIRYHRALRDPSRAGGRRRARIRSLLLLKGWGA